MVAALIAHGRLTAKELSHRTKIAAKHIKTALVALIQLNCVQFWKDSTVYYLFHERGMSVLLHAGDVCTLIKKEYGEECAEVVQNVIENGSICIKDYMGASGPEKYKKMNHLVTLFSANWLRRMKPVDKHPIEDLWNRVFQETLKNTPRNAATSEIKRVAEVTERSKVKFNELIQPADSREALTVENGIHSLRGEVILQFNLSRYEMSLRTRALVDLARSRLGPLTSSVYNAACLLVEAKGADLTHPYFSVLGLINDPEEARILQSSVENALVDNRATVFHVRDVARSLPANVDLTNSIITHRPRSAASQSPSSKRVKLEDGFAEPIENGNGYDDSEDDVEKLVVEHLRLLQNSNVPFVQETGPGLYTIPYTRLAAHVKKYNYDTLVKTTFGGEVHRVLNCIRELKLGDEKAIANLVLLRERLVKTALFRMVKHHLIEIQEVPRSADRAALKTFFLFRHKPSSAYGYVGNALIYSMAEILANVSNFKQENSILLEKCEREDVKGFELELLLETELQTLRELQSREVGNLGRLHRLKWLHFVFGVL